MFFSLLAKSKKISFLFDCFVEHHKMFCSKEDCPTRKKFTKTKHLAKVFKEDNEDENLIMITYLIETIFTESVQKSIKIFKKIKKYY